MSQSQGDHSVPKGDVGCKTDQDQTAPEAVHQMLPPLLGHVPTTIVPPLPPLFGFKKERGKGAE